MIPAACYGRAIAPLPAIAMPSRHKMDVEMINLLAARPALVHADRNAVGMQRRHKECHSLFYGEEKRRDLPVRKLDQRRCVIFRDHHRMPGARGAMSRKATT